MTRMYVRMVYHALLPVDTKPQKFAVKHPLASWLLSLWFFILFSWKEWTHTYSAKNQGRIFLDPYTTLSLNGQHVPHFLVICSTSSRLFDKIYIGHSIHYLCSLAKLAPFMPILLGCQGGGFYGLHFSHKIYLEHLMHAPSHCEGLIQSFFLVLFKVHWAHCVSRELFWANRKTIIAKG